MRKFLFTLMAMVALVLVANTTFGQSVAGDSEQPYIGTTHTYHITGMSVTVDGILSVDYDGAGENISTPRTGATAGTGELSGGVFTSTMTEIYFDITYGSNATTGDGTILVTLTDGSTNTCSNYISLVIDVLEPVFTLNLGEDATAACQTVGPGVNGTTDFASTGYTAVTYTITPDAGGATGYTYDFVLTFSGNTIQDESSGAYIATATTTTLSQSGQVITMSDVPAGATTITVYVATTEGTPATLVGTLSATPTMTLAGVNIDGTVVGAERNVPFSIMPTIGGFSGLN